MVGIVNPDGGVAAGEVAGGSVLSLDCTSESVLKKFPPAQPKILI